MDAAKLDLIKLKQCGPSLTSTTTKINVIANNDDIFDALKH